MIECYISDKISAISTGCCLPVIRIITTIIISINISITTITKTSH